LIFGLISLVIFMLYGIDWMVACLTFFV
jgi:hypothetical protein